MRVAAHAEPVRTDHELRTRERARVGVAHEVGDDLADRLTRRLDAQREPVDPIVGGRVRDARQLGRRLRAAAPTGGGRVDHADHADRSTRCGRVVGHRAHPRGVGADLLGDACVLVEHPGPALGRRRLAPPARAITTASRGPDSAPTLDNCSAAAAKPVSGASMTVLTTPRAASAPVNVAACAGSSLTTTARAAPDAPPSGAPSANAVPSRGLPPPLLACEDSAGAKTFDPNDSSTASNEPTSLVRATSSKRGGTTHATSAPFENMIWPRDDEENVSPARYAPTGPRCSGGGTEASPSATPPVDESPVDAPARDSAPSTMRVAAIGDSALTVTPGGVSCPMRQVERGDRPLRAAVRAGIAGAPAGAGRDAENAPVPGRGHERQGGAQHVEVAVDVHAEHRAPVVLHAVREAGGTADAGDVHHRVEGSELLDQVGEQACAPRLRR